MWTVEYSYCKYSPSYIFQKLQNETIVIHSQWKTFWKYVQNIKHLKKIYRLNSSTLFSSKRGDIEVGYNAIFEYCAFRKGICETNTFISDVSTFCCNHGAKSQLSGARKCAATGEKGIKASKVWINYTSHSLSVCRLKYTDNFSLTFQTSQLKILNPLFSFRKEHS